jgi:methylglutaconyl-CoA hydratase
MGTVLKITNVRRRSHRAVCYILRVPDLVQSDLAAGIATVLMNRPHARNALSVDLIEALERAVERVEADANAGRARVMILGGSGEAFCAGMDLKAVMSDPPAMRRALHGLARLMRRIRAMTIPTVARVQGAAMGGGCGLMVVTDFTVTHPEAKVGYPEVSLGLCPAVVAPWLIRRIGAGPARAMLLGGRAVSGTEAQEIGLATHLAPRAELDAAASALAADLAHGSAAALAVTKRWLNELEGPLDEAAAARGADLSADVLAGPEAQSRLRARFG